MGIHFAPILQDLLFALIQVIKEKSYFLGYLYKGILQHIMAGISKISAAGKREFLLPFIIKTLIKTEVLSSHRMSMGVFRKQERTASISVRVFQENPGPTGECPPQNAGSQSGSARNYTAPDNLAQPRLARACLLPYISQPGEEIAPADQQGTKQGHSANLYPPWNTAGPKGGGVHDHEGPNSLRAAAGKTHPIAPPQSCMTREYVRISRKSSNR